MALDLKVCRLCKETLPLSDFYPDKAIRSGYKTACIACLTEGRTRRHVQVEYNEPQIVEEWRAAASVASGEARERLERLADQLEHIVLCRGVFTPQAPRMVRLKIRYADSP